MIKTCTGDGDALTIHFICWPAFAFNFVSRNVPDVNEKMLFSFAFRENICYIIFISCMIRKIN